MLSRDWRAWNASTRSTSSGRTGRVWTGAPSDNATSASHRAGNGTSDMRASLGPWSYARDVTITSASETQSAIEPETTVHHRTCPLCEAACGLEITVKGEQVVRIRGDRDNP